jgi:glycosyltransferase involved in cell wall biosynthesis
MNTKIDKLNVTLIFRCKSKRRISIEKLFSNFVDDSITAPIFLPVDFNSIKNILDIFLCLLQINTPIIHVTGDVHFVVWMLFWKKSILTIHDLNYYYTLRGLKKWAYYLFWLFLPILFSNKLVFISNETKLSTLKLFPFAAKKSIVIYNGVQVINPSISKSEKTINHGLIKIFAIGTAFNKNIEGLLFAVHQLKMLKYKIQVTILGDFSAKQQELINQLNLQNNVKKILSLSEQELSDEYFKADVLFFASYSEGFGLPIVEAQLIGIPVITSNLSSMPEIAGKGALFVNPYSISEIQKAVLKVINEGCDDIVTEGLINASRFSYNDFFNSYKEVYISIK